MTRCADNTLMGNIHQNDTHLPLVNSASLSQAIERFSKAEYNDFIIRPGEIHFEEDRLLIGKNEMHLMTSPFMDQIMKITEMKAKQLTSLGEEKFLENLNYIFEQRTHTDYVLRTVNGVAYSILSQSQRRTNPLNHKAFLEGVADMVGKEFSEDALWKITAAGHKLKVTTTHPTKEFDIGHGVGDIQREGMEFMNNDTSSKMSFHYHLLRTACTNSTVFPRFFAAERDSSEGPAGFDRFLRDSMRMFDEGKEIIPAYQAMCETPLTIGSFNEIYKKIEKASKTDMPKILFPYLKADLVNNKLHFNEEKIQERTKWDLFNDLTHYSKGCRPGVQQRAQSIAGEMVLDLMTEQNPRMRARMNKGL